MWYIHTTDCHSAFKKQEILPYDNMDEPEGNHAKVNKPATERQIHDAAYMGYGKQPNP